jgi:hypothetical protein
MGCPTRRITNDVCQATARWRELFAGRSQDFLRMRRSLFNTFVGQFIAADVGHVPILPRFNPSTTNGQKKVTVPWSRRPINASCAPAGSSGNFLARQRRKSRSRVRRYGIVGRSFVGEHSELSQTGRSEACRNRDVCRVSSSRDDDATNSRMVVPRIERVPPVAKKDLKPRAEVHRGRISWHTDITEIACAIASGNVHAAAETNGQMGEVTAHTNPLEVPFGSGPIVSREMIAKLNMGVHVIADRLHATPPALNMTEKAPREIVQLLRIAITAPD